MSSLRSISKITGLSVATVSRAMRDDAKVRPKTKARVLAAAEKFGYQRNQHLGEMMSAVRRRASGAFHGNLALIWPERRRYWTNDRPLREMRAAAFRRARELQFAMDEMFFSAKHPDRLREVLFHRGISGVIISAPSSIVSGFEMPVDLAQFACVTIGSGLAYPRMDHVLFNTYAGMRLAVDAAAREFGAGIAAVWDFHSEAATGRTAVGAFLACHPGGPALASELFWNRADLRRAKISGLIRQHNIRCLILFPRLLPPAWLAELIPPHHFIWHNYPPRLGGFGWVDLGNQQAGVRAVDLVAAKIHMNQTGVQGTSQSIMIAPSWVASRERIST